MSDSLRVYRKEIKYVISRSTAADVRNELAQIIKRDSHGGVEGYRVKSLYFDTYSNNDYYSKLAGEENRKKIRLRIYDEAADKCKLELKQKYGDNQLKESLLISKECAEKLMLGEYGQLLSMDSDLAVKLYGLMMIEHYRPVTMVEYFRDAYTYPLYDIRVTIDSDIKYSFTNHDIFDRNIIYTPETDGVTVLEVKYTGKMVGFIADTLAKYNVSQSSFSKYAASRVIF